MVSGMHVQAPQIRDIHARAKAAGKPMALGGPSVSAAPEMYPDIEYLHIGEMGDATDALIERLDADVSPPAEQVRFTTKERLPLGDFPIPAYGLIKLGQYLIGSIQFSSGCPYQCEFCDIPGLYGRVPRLKTPEQIIAELDVHAGAAVASADHLFRRRQFHRQPQGGARSAAASRRMAEAPRLSRWRSPARRRSTSPSRPRSSKLMQAASFVNIFVGIETPDLDALKRMRKEQNATLPMMESIRTLNSYGMEVTSGIILGLDTDTETTADRLIEFIEQSKIPMLTINLLHALPKTPLWDRLQRANRIIDDPTLESNVRFLRPYDDVVASWRRCHRARLRSGAAVRALLAPGRDDLRQPHQPVRPRQADLRQPAHGRGAGVAAAAARSASSRTTAGISGARPSTPSSTARSTP